MMCERAFISARNIHLVRGKIKITFLQTKLLDFYNLRF